jgi:DNA replication protein DnaC
VSENVTSQIDQSRNGDFLDDYEAREQRRAEAERFEQAVNLWRQSGVPRLHANKTADVLQSGDEHPWQEKYKALKSRLGKGFCVVLSGRRGTGKTQMAACLCWDACRQRMRTRFVTAMDIFLDVRASYHKNGPTEKEVIGRYTTDRTAPVLLVIDEAHERGESPWEDRMLAHIVNKRYGEQLDTLILTNDEPTAATKSLGPSITDRIREVGAVVRCEWDSFRGATTSEAVQHG